MLLAVVSTNKLLAALRTTCVFHSGDVARASAQARHASTERRRMHDRKKQARLSGGTSSVWLSTDSWRKRQKWRFSLAPASRVAFRLMVNSVVGRPTRRRTPSVMTSAPVPPAPPLTCPQCSEPLSYRHTVFGGIEESERWDYYECWTCGPFQLRQRTGAVRALRDPSRRKDKRR